MPAFETPCCSTSRAVEWLMPRDRNRGAIHWNLNDQELQSTTATPHGELALPCSPMFLRELRGEVLENVALNLLISRRLQRDFWIPRLL